MKTILNGLGLAVLVLMCGTAGSSVFGQQTESQRIVVERDRAAQAQNPGEAAERAAVEQALIQAPQGGPRPGDFIFLATEMSFGGKLVKGAPYSAQAVTETVQTLTDGNRISRKTTATVYRDSEGRARREQTLTAIGNFAKSGEPSQTIYISDPVAGTAYTLDPNSQTATKMPPMRFKVSSADKERTPFEVRPLEPAVQSRVRTAQVQNELGQGEKFRIAVAPSVMDKKTYEAGVALGFLDANNPNAKTEALGKQNINGVEAEGTRSTVTIPAGEIGNERAIEIISERWYSPELQVIVMTRHSDPRFGETSYQLMNINRNEPARELFQVPPGYSIRDNSIAPAVGSGIRGGVLNGKAITLPHPQYPPIAMQAKATGSVTVNVTIDEEGNVISASAVDGHPLLRSAAVDAARRARFSPTKLSGQPVKVTGVLVYEFRVE